MTEDEFPFEFSDDPAASLADPPTAHDRSPLVVNLPSGLRSKQKLLAEYVRQLSLPEYFGWNWDALDECLRDLSWLEPDRPVVIVHAALPFHGHKHPRQTYLELLRDAVRFWTDGPRPDRLRVIFSRRAETTIRQMLAPHAGR